MNSIVVGATSTRPDDDVKKHIRTATTVLIDGEEQELWHSHPERLPTVQYNRGDIWRWRGGSTWLVRAPSWTIRSTCSRGMASGLPLAGTGKEVRYDVYGNVSYGAVGKEVGFREKVLMAGSHCPKYCGNTDPAGDAAISVGFQFGRSDPPWACRT